MASFNVIVGARFMLDAKSLEVLQSLKTDIKASKTVLTGKVKGTGRTFGFVSADDGTEHFLPPDEMSKVFPGDEVTFTVTEQDDGKTRAELESLVQSDLDEFVGVFNVRGSAQGVDPFSNAFSGWLFVPPKQINEAESNDIVIAQVVRHPWKTGKAQAKVIRSLGSSDNNRSWYSMSLREHGIPELFTDEELAEASKLSTLDLTTLTDYQDCTDKPFITIDSASTLDMDDALFAEKTNEGWQLNVAIADASAFIDEGSILDLSARKRLCTTYLPGLTVPMVPEVLANEAISLIEGNVRPAMIFKLSIDTDGQVTNLETHTALIKSTGKLSYTEVSQWLLGESPLPEKHEHLKVLQDATSAMATWRATHANQMQNRADYRVKVDGEFNVTHVDKEERNIARDIVEEAMVATNFIVAKWLKDEDAIFMTHSGFKADRETELKGLLRDYAEEVAELNGYDLGDFRKILSKAYSVESFPLTSVLQKRFDRGQWSLTSAPHFGLGLEQYTNVTSPIRKYTDLVIHRLIKAKLKNQQLEFDHTIVSELNERGNVPRTVGHTVENRLRYKWLIKQEAQTWNATIVHINANGLIAQLDDNGATGFVDLRKKKDKFSYDPLRMVLKFEDFQYQLGQKLSVQIGKLEDSNLILTISQVK